MKDIIKHKQLAGSLDRAFGVINNSTDDEAIDLINDMSEQIAALVEQINNWSEELPWTASFDKMRDEMSFVCDKYCQENLH